MFHKKYTYKYKDIYSIYYIHYYLSTAYIWFRGSIQSFLLDIM